MYKRIIGLGVVGLLVTGSIALLRVRGSARSQESTPPAAATGNRKAARSTAAMDEPARTTVSDSREFGLLWRDLDLLKQQTQRLGPAEYKIRCVQRTATFLQLDDAATAQFAKNVDLALQDFRIARKRMETAQVAYNPDKRESVTLYRATWNRYSKDRQGAVGRFYAMLTASPRQQLFKDQGLKWVMRLEQSSEEAGKPGRAKGSAKLPTAEGANVAPMRNLP